MTTPATVVSPSVQAICFFEIIFLFLFGLGVYNALVMVEVAFIVCVRFGYRHSGGRFMSTSVNSLPDFGSLEK
jgi:hypothetical protein